MIQICIFSFRFRFFFSCFSNTFTFSFCAVIKHELINKKNLVSTHRGGRRWCTRPLCRFDTYPQGRLGTFTTKMAAPQWVVLQISSDADDRMGAKSKPKIISEPKINPQKIPCRIPSIKNFPESIKCYNTKNKLEIEYLCLRL